MIIFLAILVSGAKIILYTPVGLILLIIGLYYIHWSYKKFEKEYGVTVWQLYAGIVSEKDNKKIKYIIKNIKEKNKGKKVRSSTRVKQSLIKSEKNRDKIKREKIIIVISLLLFFSLFNRFEYLFYPSWERKNIIEDTNLREELFSYQIQKYIFGNKSLDDPLQREWERSLDEYSLKTKFFKIAKYMLFISLSSFICYLHIKKSKKRIISSKS